MDRTRRNHLRITYSNPNTHQKQLEQEMKDND